MSLDLLDHNTVVISPSGLEKLKTCARIWKHTYIDKRVAALPNAAAAAGKAFDAALNLRYTTARNGAVDAALEERMLQAVDDAYAGLDLPLEEHRTPARFKEVVQLYNRNYGREPFDVLAVQMPFTVELGVVEVGSKFWDAYLTGRANAGEVVSRWNLSKPPPPVRVLLHGILDLLVQDSATGQTLICDTKTSKDWGSMQQSGYENHAQLKAYCYAVPRIAPDAERMGLTAGLTPEQLAQLARLPRIVHGAMPNIVVIRPPYKREGSAEKSNAKPRTEFHRFVVYYSQERLEEWRTDALFSVEQALQWVARDHYPQNEKACANVYGKRCPYIDCCTAPTHQRPMILGSDMFVDYTSPFSTTPNPSATNPLDTAQP